MSRPLDITAMADSAAVVALVSFSETVSTRAGFVAPEGLGFVLTLHGKKRSKSFETAAPAVRALRRASK